MKAAVLRAYNTPLEIENVELGNPGPREVRVRTAATGVCRYFDEEIRHLFSVIGS